MIVLGDCRDTMRRWIADGVKVQCCVTSPPYWGLRDYGTAEWQGGHNGCEHKRKLGGNGEASAKQVTSAGTQNYWHRGIACPDCGARRIDRQLGLEPTPAEYVANMVEVFGLVRELLADDGVLWLNLGDSYSAYNGNAGPSSGFSAGSAADTQRPKLESGHGLRTKGLKPKDLCGIPWRLAFALQADGWYLRQDIIWSKPNPMPESVTDRCTKAHEYLFLLAKSERYYYDQEPIREPISPNWSPDNAPTVNELGAHVLAGGQRKQRRMAYDEPKGANRRSVWTIATQPYSEAHFATFPRALVEPCIAAGSRVGDTVLDPFMGSGTVGQVAQDLGRKWLGCELNPAYIKLAEKRTAQQGLPLAAD